MSSGGSTTVRLALSIRWTGEFKHLFSLAIGSESKSNVELVAIDFSMVVITGDLGFTDFCNSYLQVSAGYSPRPAMLLLGSRA